MHLPAGAGWLYVPHLSQCMPAGIQWEGIRTADWFDAGNTMHVVAACDQPDLSAVAASLCLHCVDCASCYSSGYILLWQREACSELCARAKLHALYKGYLLLCLLLWYGSSFFGLVRYVMVRSSTNALFGPACCSIFSMHLCVCHPLVPFGAELLVLYCSIPQLRPAVGTLEGPKAILPAFTL